MATRIMAAQAPMDFATEQQSIERRRRMAELLAQQADQPIPVGQVVGNRFVAPTPIRGLTQLLNAYNSGQELRDLDRQQAASVAREREGAAQDMNAVTQALLGGGAEYTQAGMTGGLDESDYGRQTAAPDPRRAVQIALASSRPQVQALGQSLLAAQLAQQKENPFARLNPSDYTPESLQAFAASGGRDYGVLRPRTRLDFQNTGGAIQAFDPYTGQPAGQAVPRTVSPDAQLRADLDMFQWRNPSTYQQGQLGIDRARLSNDGARLQFETGLPGAGVPRVPASPVAPALAAPPGPLAAPFGQQAAPMPAPTGAPVPQPQPGVRPQVAPMAAPGAGMQAPGAQPLPIGVTPKDAAAMAREQAERDIAARRGWPEQVSQLRNVVGTVDRALADVGRNTAGLVGAALGMIPGTDARDLQGTIDTIKANLAFGELQRMRAMSPTGGALGAVSERELTLLESALQSLDRSQSPSQLRANLERVREHYVNWSRNLAQAAGQPAPDLRPSFALPSALRSSGSAAADPAGRLQQPLPGAGPANLPPGFRLDR